MEAWLESTCGSAEGSAIVGLEVGLEVPVEVQVDVQVEHWWMYYLLGRKNQWRYRWKQSQFSFV